ncbi:MAG: AMMECR1 domain-containing protein [Desulfurococcales archaeon ex4484_58]|nr:MAG: AMMECR1 domain-containing protein [Desulfurococcales archaeon ex4484_58]
MEKPIHPDELSFEDGVFLVKLARKTLREKLVKNIEIKPPLDTPKHLLRPGMVFTTIEKFLGENQYALRGCIGFLSPIYSLVKATIKSTIEAALNDPRFPPMTSDELDQVVLEVTVLSLPEEIVVDNRWDLPAKINIGRDGLVVEKGFFKGTLLPMVPIEYCWDQETFLAETCIKARLPPDCWLDKNVKVSKYVGKAFKEKTPNGEIYERDLTKEYRELCFTEK